MLEPCSYTQFIKNHQQLDNEINFKHVDEVISMLNGKLKSKSTTPIEHIKQLHAPVYLYSIINDATLYKVADLFEKSGWKKVKFERDNTGNAKLVTYIFYVN